MKGFFSFLIVFFIIIFLINTNIFFEKQNNEKNKLINNLIEIEQYNKERTLIENNLDKIIRIKLDEKLGKNNFDLISSKNEINLQILKYLKNKAFQSDLFLENEEELNINILNQITNLEIIETKNLKYMQFIFTSDILRNKNISKKFGLKTELIFKIPIGYKIRTLIFNV